MEEGTIKVDSLRMKIFVATDVESAVGLLLLAVWEVESFSNGNRSHHHCCQAVVLVFLLT